MVMKRKWGVQMYPNSHYSGSLQCPALCRNMCQLNSYRKCKHNWESPVDLRLPQHSGFGKHLRWDLEYSHLHRTCYIWFFLITLCQTGQGGLFYFTLVFCKIQVFVSNKIIPSWKCQEKLDCYDLPLLVPASQPHISNNEMGHKKHAV